jgi:hypothetical protein
MGGAGVEPVLRMVMGSLVGGPPVDVVKLPGAVGVKAGAAVPALVVFLGGGAALGTTAPGTPAVGAVAVGDAAPVTEGAADELAGPVDSGVPATLLDMGGSAIRVGPIGRSDVPTPVTTATTTATVEAAAPSQGSTEVELLAAIDATALALPAPIAR